MRWWPSQKPLFFFFLRVRQTFHIMTEFIFLYITIISFRAPHWILIFALRGYDSMQHFQNRNMLSLYVNLIYLYECLKILQNEDKVSFHRYKVRGRKVTGWNLMMMTNLKTWLHPPHKRTLLTYTCPSGNVELTNCLLQENAISSLEIVPWPSGWTLSPVKMLRSLIQRGDPAHGLPGLSRLS